MLEMSFLFLSWAAVTAIWINTKYKEEDLQQKRLADEKNNYSEQSEQMYDIYKDWR